MSVVAFATTTSTCGRNVSNYGPRMKTRCLKLWPKFENKMLRLVAQLWKKKVGPLVLQETRGGTSQPIEGAQNKILEMMVSQNWTSLIMNGGYYHLMKWWFPKPKLHKQWMVGDEKMVPPEQRSTSMKLGPIRRRSEAQRKCLNWIFQFLIEIVSHLLMEFEGLLGLVSHDNRSKMEESVDWGNRLTQKRVMRLVRRRRSNRFGRTIE